MKNKILLLAFLCAVTLLVLGGAGGTLYRGKFGEGGYSPAFIGDGSGLTNIPFAGVIGAGGATNGIQMLDGYGTNNCSPNQQKGAPGYRYFVYNTRTCEAYNHE